MNSALVLLAACLPLHELGSDGDTEPHMPHNHVKPESALEPESSLGCIYEETACCMSLLPGWTSAQRTEAHGRSPSPPPHPPRPLPDFLSRQTPPQNTASARDAARVSSAQHLKPSGLAPGGKQPCGAPGRGNSSFSTLKRGGLLPSSESQRPTATLCLQALAAKPATCPTPTSGPRRRVRSRSAHLTLAARAGVHTHARTPGPGRRPPAGRPPNPPRPGRWGAGPSGAEARPRPGRGRVAPRRPAGPLPFHPGLPPAHVPGDRPPIGSIPATGSE